MTKTIQMAILLGRGERADIAIAELWRRAQSAVSEGDVKIRCIAAHIQFAHTEAFFSHPEVEIIRLTVPSEGGPATLLTTWAAKPGPLGVVARLAQYNLGSRRVARALKRNPGLTEVFCQSHVIVSADPEADRAVWNLRRRTRAHLMHGAFAMVHALYMVAKD